ncbi:hypothetical protein E4V99_14000 [Microbacterium sp. dk485]|uniref:hypothetical protein n=1 Tax=Microbacterium sp. dk485 TaxID=2560021 RepID=UPI001073922C|nr:hypothetical protein [Microbacterium sp. dk485]TFV82042.1 hypothetical protein E4V99_14000 [Microbacterium sp. dk485]
MRISLLIDSPLAVLMHAMRGLDADVRKQIAQHTKGNAEPIWKDTTREQAGTRLQSRLAQSARVGVTQQNVFLRAGAVGRLSSGTAISDLAQAIEWGANPGKTVTTRSRKGTAYKRRLGPTFGAPRRSGHVAHPAAKVSVSRIASLWVQTAYRTIHEAIEKV